VLVNFHESSLEVRVLRDGGVVHCFEFQVFGGSRRDGKIFFEGLPDVEGVILILVRVDEGKVDGHGEGAKALVIGIMSMVDPGLIGDLVIYILLLSRFGGGDGIPGTNGAEVASNEGHPLLVVGALKHGDMADEGGGGVGHFVRGLILG